MSRNRTAPTLSLLLALALAVPACASSIAPRSGAPVLLWSFGLSPNAGETVVELPVGAEIVEVLRSDRRVGPDGRFAVVVFYTAPATDPLVFESRRFVVSLSAGVFEPGAVHVATVRAALETDTIESGEIVHVLELTGKADS